MKRIRRRKFINKGLQRKLIAAFVGVATYCSFFQMYLMNRSIAQLGERMDTKPGVLDGLSTVLQDNLATTLCVLVPTMWAFGVFVTHRIAGPLYRLEQHLAAIAAGEDPGPCRLRKFDELGQLCETMNAAVDRLRSGNPKLSTNDVGEARSLLDRTIAAAPASESRSQSATVHK